MPFFLIKGHFRPKAGIPEGASVRFRADNSALWMKLEGRLPELGTGPETQGTVQLRLEGIDAIEAGATRPLAIHARNNLLKLIGFEEGIDDEPEGFILTRMTDDESGRPICFAFAGSIDRNDGAEVSLDKALVRRSVNFKQLAGGFPYPLYNTLFASLSETISEALDKARKDDEGYWPSDATLEGVR